MAVADGLGEIKLKTWGEFEDNIRDWMLDYRHFVWRGHSSANWILEPTLDRLLKKIGKIDDINARREHLNRFKYASRGRRGINPPLLTDDNDWWALGQHQGLATPLLDWTSSPFVAAYFAFISDNDYGSTENAIFGISQASIYLKSKLIVHDFGNKERPPIIEFIEPLSNENNRLVSQGGLFTRAPDGVDVESWVRTNFKGETEFYRLMKFIIPKSERNICLRSLNRMNINHLSLFPDLYGASNYCNTDLLIDKY